MTEEQKADLLEAKRQLGEVIGKIQTVKDNLVEPDEKDDDDDDDEEDSVDAKLEKVLDDLDTIETDLADITAS